MRKNLSVVVALAICSPLINSQQPQAAPEAPTSAQPALAITEKPRVFITDSESWETRGSAGGSNGSFAAQSHGGARPQTAEIIKTFGQRCPGVLVNNRQEIADYVVLLDHEGGKGYLQHRNKVAVFEYVSGDVVISKSTLSLGGSVEDACNGIVAHWSAHSKELLAKKEAPAAATQPAPTLIPAAVVAPPPPVIQASVLVDSVPAGADIEIDGAFVGNTPSTISLAPGGHQIAVKKKGFSDWTKTLNVTSGAVHLNAELEQEPPKH